MHKQMILPTDLVCEKILLHKPAAAHGWEVLGYQTGRGNETKTKTKQNKKKKNEWTG